MFKRAAYFIKNDSQAADIRRAIAHLFSIANSKGRTGNIGALAEPLNSGDPGLLWSWARNPIWDDDEAATEVLQEVTLELMELCPSRKDQIREILLALARRTSGDSDALYPLLYGPPGTGKTFLVELLASVISEKWGQRVSSIIQPMTQMGYSRANNEIEMSLQGTSSHWGEGRPGMLFHSCNSPDTPISLVVLDECDKCDQHDYLVTLLDPRAPLQDNFVREFFPEMSMRNKILFFLTCNDLSKIRRHEALWSRLYPIEMPEYTREEAEDLVVALVQRRVSWVDEEEIEETALDVMAGYRVLPSIRMIIDAVQKKLWVERFPFLRAEEKTVAGKPRKGNRVSSVNVICNL